MEQGVSSRDPSGPYSTNPQRALRPLPNPFQPTSSTVIRTDRLANSSSTTLTDGPFVTSPLHLRNNSAGPSSPPLRSGPTPLVAVNSEAPSVTFASTVPSSTVSSPHPQQTDRRQPNSQYLAVPRHAATLGAIPQSGSQVQPTFDDNLTQPRPQRPNEFGIYTNRTFNDPYSNAVGSSSLPSTRVPSSTSLQGKGDYAAEDTEYKGYGYGYTPGYSKLPPNSAASDQGFLLKAPPSAHTSGWPGEEPSSSERLARMFETRKYERPSYPALAVHTLLCMFAYPVLFLTALAASGRTLFWSRLITGVGCGIVGLALGMSLIRFARRHLEACTWATVIHESLPPTGSLTVQQRPNDPPSPVPISFIKSGGSVSVSSLSHASRTTSPHIPTKRASSWLPRSPNTPIAPVTPDSIHHDAPGVKLSDLSARSSDSSSALVAMQVLQARWQLWKLRRVSRTKEKEREKERRKASNAAGVGRGFWADVYGNRDDMTKDNYGWANHILFFLCLVGLAGILPFILGRFVEIGTFTEHSLDRWDEVPVFGDLSEADIASSQTLLGAFESFIQTWTLSPFASLTTLPQAVAFQYEPMNSTVYFAEAYTSQLRTDGIALGTYNYSHSTPLDEGVRQPALNATFLEGGTRVNGNKDASDAAEGALVQFPKWGIRIECDLLPDMDKYFIPVSPDDLTYIFTPKFLIDELFTRLSIPPPSLAPADLSVWLSPNDTLPVGTDPNEIVFIRRFSQNGVAHSFGSGPAGPGDGSGFYEIELHLIRINQTLTPQGSFPILGPLITSEGDPDGSRIGYDVAVCIEVYEPWIVEAFNSSSGVLPVTTRIIGRGNEMIDESIDSMGSGVPGAKRRSRYVGVERVLSSEGKGDVFAVAHDNSVNQMVKDNGRDNDYVPSPTAISWTDGSGPQGYTKLNPLRVAAARAVADSTNVLPYLAGSKQLIARVYKDRTLANARLLPWLTIAALGVVFVIGVLAGFTVPRLPLGVPRRGFDLMSWLAVLHGDGMVGHVPEKRKKAQSGTLNEDGTPTLEEKMPLSEVEKRMGEMRVRYVL